jgi:IS4 transposase
MVLSTIFERFVKAAPACVMHRALMENIFAAEKLDAVFRDAAELQYERELLFSTLVALTSQVVCRVSANTRSAYLSQRERITVSVGAVYQKLRNVEPRTSRALVQHTARQASALIDRCKGSRTPLLPGYNTLILDGNHLGKTEHRLKVLRKTSAGALPGQSLVVLDPLRMVIADLIPCEDGHAQERSLLGQVLEIVKPRDLWIEDRNFCTLGFLFGVAARQACYLVRQHGRMPWKPLENKARYVGRSETGRVYEERIELRNPETGRVTQVRRITVRLKSPTRDGDSEIHLLTNLPAKVSALKVAALYRKRWTLEQAFNELTTHLRCELNTLGYPKAALFGFCVAVAAYNLLAATKGALRGVHGEEKLEKEVSNLYLTKEINTVYGGMMVAVPPTEWEEFQTLSSAKLATQLLCWARGADLRNYPKSSRGPKKPKPKRPNAQFQHVATARLLDPQRFPSKRKRKTAAIPDD